MGILKNLVIAVTGTLPADTSQLKKWTEANDGRYSPNVRKGVTHLVTGPDAWKNATDPVQAAVEVGAFVVSYDWLEDSLQRKRKLAETKYTWEHLWQERKRRKQMKRIGTLNDTIKFNKGCEEAKKATGTGKSKSRTATRRPKPSKSFFFGEVVNVPFVSAADDLKRRREEREAAKAKATAKKAEETRSDRAISRAPSATTESLSSPSSATPHALSTTSSQADSSAAGPQAKKPSLKDLYHYYLDITGFEYKIILTRCNLHANQITRYRLSILESHTKPHVYCTFVEYFPPGVGAAGSGEAGCIQALMDYNTTFVDSVVEEPDTDDVSTHDGESVPDTALSSPQQDAHSYLQAAHLRSLLAPPMPSPTTPYKTLLAPMNSAFNTAWRAFRHAFRDLTLLSWEERFDVSKTLYKARALHFNTEPFVYVRPKPGLPLGIRVQEAGLFQNQTLPCIDKDSNVVSHAQEETARIAALMGNNHDIGNDENYAYDAHSLPALAHPLGTGIIGTALQRDAAAARKAAEQQARLAEEAEAERLRRQGPARSNEAKKQKKPNFSRPLFNGVTGRPTIDA